MLIQNNLNVMTKNEATSTRSKAVVVFFAPAGAASDFSTNGRDGEIEALSFWTTQLVASSFRLPRRQLTEEEYEAATGGGVSVKPLITDNAVDGLEHVSRHIQGGWYAATVVGSRFCCVVAKLHAGACRSAPSINRRRHSIRIDAKIAAPISMCVSAIVPSRPVP